MKKLTAVTLLTLVLAFALSACGKAEDFYPREELSSEGINQESLDYFKTVFKECEDLFFEDYAIRITHHGGDNFVTLFGLDSTGKAVANYDIQGDLCNDILIGTFEDNSSCMGYKYDLDVEEGKKNNTITGTRHLSKEKLENQSFAINYKAELIKAGYDDSSFTYDVSTDTLKYGDFKITGDMKVSLVNELYDLPSLGPGYDFTQSKGVIDTTLKNEG